MRIVATEVKKKLSYILIVEKSPAQEKTCKIAIKNCLLNTDQLISQYIHSYVTV